jgi:hypothetical protein
MLRGDVERKKKKKKKKREWRQTVDAIPVLR